MPQRRKGGGKERVRSRSRRRSRRRRRQRLDEQGKQKYADKS